ncbi:BREX-1 system adenine-specific DNA-methyltransferase PglX [Clostridium tarantellae]|uniref:site-specific DNA-methyltransferase (adenine-specific) n=1 Tax=Clostridium tarantellae TaxID=39493 RepID=A0A6I1MK40_9CLOT|nr:BREX-1 system adenine-specific DNA-methyltransferase PglX [Clostridium tarantellae]MPQ42517.1 BREX-1 system adenine-specific DNA-methyltransferase PglX [Clostridium tarantellae]
MDKSKIKSYAIWARKALIGAVGDRAAKIGINKDGTVLDIERLQGGFKVVGREDLFNIDPSHRDTLVRLIKEKGYKQVLEEVAYTWFNRFMGLRFMEVNDYLPTGVRILSSEEGKSEPDVLSRVSEIAEDLNLNLQYVYELQDKGDKDSITELYKYILIKQCNELGNIIPQMFEKISDYTELLLPDNLLEADSVIRKMVEDIAEEDWKEEVEIIGWMYQYYISEKKDEVFAALKKNVKITKENIPAATQLFTPKWIVKYMVENSLGRLWLEGHPNEELQKEWKYYLEEAQQEPEVEEELKKIREEHSKLTPEDIKVLDPCMGSGHILVYAFDVLYEIYKSAGYSEREIPRKILQNNLYGLDIDDRAAQLASFALIMKARHYNRRLFREIERENIELNLCSIQESNGINKETIDYFCSLQTGLNNEELRKDLEYLTTTFTDAKEYGSILEVEKVNFEALKQRLREIEDDYNFMFGDYRKVLLDKVPNLIKQAEVMSKKYEVCVTNPPYMGAKGIGLKLLKYVQEIYPDAKSDLFAIFIEKCSNLIKINGFQSMITQHAFMFLSSYEKLRKKLVVKDFVNMAHLGARAFEEIGGEVVQTTTWILRNSNIKNYMATYLRLVDYNNQKAKELSFLNKENKYIAKKGNFTKIPNISIAYWISNRVLDIFYKEQRLGDLFPVKKGLDTGNNDKYLRLWQEINYNKFGNGFKKSQDFTCANKKWAPHDKGGTFRRWYGNNEYVINWENNGFELRNSTANLRSEKYYFNDAITWSSLSSGNIGFRFSNQGAISNTAGSSLYPNKEMMNYLVGILNTKVIQKMINVVSPTLNYSAGPISSIPILIKSSKDIDSLVYKNINVSKNDWDSFETSWVTKLLQQI